MAAGRQGSFRPGVCALAEKLRFLSDSSSYAHRPARVEVVETHMSYVFLAGELVYKLKKPVRYPFLDFSTVEARERNCREELRLNRRLAADVYLGVRALTEDRRGLAIEGAGQTVDWLVEMRRLPSGLMLDNILRERPVRASELEALCGVLLDFYRRAERSRISAQDYVDRFALEQDINRDILTRRDFALDHGRTPRILDRLDRRYEAERPTLEARVTGGDVVDGHGDLRPEHICLTHPIVIFDCLEFNADLRQVDPFDELALLGVECALLGSPDILRRLVETISSGLGFATPPWRLVSFYAAWRALLRARLCIAHLLDPAPREPAKWEPLASRYLDLAQRALDEDS
jgi:aminoglycoside phosphotransferase family enzyme